MDGPGGLDVPLRHMVFATLRPSRFPLLQQGLSSSMILLGAVLLLCMPASAAGQLFARQPKQVVAATVVETAAYTPCGHRCSEGADPARAFCLRAGEQTLVGEGRSYLHEAKFSGMEDYGGKQVQIRFNGRWIWITAADGTQTRIRRGSEYEEFKDRNCAAEVNRPILARANRQRRPAKVPADAVAIAGPQEGDNPQRFLWYACAMDSGTIRCRRWYPKGDAYGDDWYCAKTLDGKPVDGQFTVNALESDAGHLVLSSGGVLEHDQRSRVDGKLDRPGTPCY